MTVRTLTASPSLALLYAKAALPAMPGGQLLPGIPSSRPDTLPDLELRLPRQRIDAGEVVSYRRVCGFSTSLTVPATYPHVVVFPLHLALMTEAMFPFAPMGLVHVENTIRQLAPIEVEDEVDLVARAENLRDHPRGRQFTIVSEATRGGEVVWRDETVLLSRSKAEARHGSAGSVGSVGSVGPAADDLPPQAPAGPVVWNLPGSLGRSYASASGDRNPIHLYGLTAKVFGFKRHIVHGMWTKARALAELESRLPPSYDVAVSFKKPILLPSQVRFGERDEGRRIDFGVTSASGETTHLLGRITPH